MNCKRILVPFLLLLGLAGPGLAVVTNTWTGASAFYWTNGPGWSLGHPPAAGETAAITNRTIILTEPTERMASFLITKGTLVFTNWGTSLSADTIELDNGGTLTPVAAFTNNGISNRVWITCNDLLIGTGGVISADAKGYISDNGPGVSTAVSTTTSGGASHGGNGGIASSGSAVGGVYGSPVTPAAPGSGAGKSSSNFGGTGGGVIRIEAANRITANGLISASGAAGGVGNSRDAGGGSGGSVWMTCDTFAGTSGTIRANGARTSAIAGGGGGGRIALHYNPTAQGLLARPAVVFQANPGLGGYPHKDRYQMADWGTLYFTDASGVFSVSNTIAGFSGHIVLPSPLGMIQADNLVLTNSYLGFYEPAFAFRIATTITIATNAGLIGRGAVTLTCQTLTNAGIIKLGSNSVVATGGDLIQTNGEFCLRWGSTLAVTGNWETAGSNALASLQISEGGVTGHILFASGSSFQLLAAPTNGTPAAWGARLRTDDDIRLESGSWIYPYSDSLNGGSPFFLCRNMLVDGTSGFNADGRGYSQDSGPGAGATGNTDPASGGGHGGRGGNDSNGRVGGGTYGSALQPLTAGSGGGHTTSTSGGAGGGVIRVEASGRILINGTLSANGIDGGSFVGREGGGGAGGAIYLACDTFAGTNGTVSANGGRGYISSTFAGGGGGGRISVQYNQAPQSALQRPAVSFSANPGPQQLVIRPWLMSDWGTLCFSDFVNLVTTNEAPSGYSGYLVITGGLSECALNGLSVIGTAFGFDMPGQSLKVLNNVYVGPDGALLGRDNQAFSCASFTNMGVTRFGTNNAFTVSGDAVLSNSFSLRTDSIGTFGRDIQMLGTGSLLSVDGADIRVGRDLQIQTGVVFSVFGKATNNEPRAWGARVSVTGTVTLASGGWIHPWSDSLNGGSPLFVCGTLAVEPLAGFNANGKGYSPARGPGLGASGNPSGGGGHGGRGGNGSGVPIGGKTNGLAYFPLNAGSGGGNGTSGTGGGGGGAIRIQAGAVTLNGTLTANGANSGAPSSAGRDNGGGAGGSIYVIASTFSGDPASALSARGGNSTTNIGGTVGGGGGGGGRIAVWTRATTGLVVWAVSNTNRLILSPSLSTYAGATSVAGGTGWQAGTNGTLWFISFPPPKGSLILFN